MVSETENPCTHSYKFQSDEDGHQFLLEFKQYTCSGGRERVSEKTFTIWSVGNRTRKETSSDVAYLWPASRYAVGRRGWQFCRRTGHQYVASQWWYYLRWYGMGLRCKVWGLGRWGGSRSAFRVLVDRLSGAQEEVLLNLLEVRVIVMTTRLQVPLRDRDLVIVELRNSELFFNGHYP